MPLEADMMKQTIPTLFLAGLAAIVSAMLLLDIDDWQRFIAYAVLVPFANICFAIALLVLVRALVDET